MNTAPPVLEELLRRALDQLNRQEQRAEMLEALLLQVTAQARSRRPDDTPLPGKLLARRPDPPADPERMRQLEARLRDAEQRLAAADERLRQARRLETIGRLVAGVAHDFNNLLTVISGNAEVVRDWFPPADPRREPAELIAATARTAAGVTRQLLAFARPSAADPCPVDLSAAVRGLERVLRRLVGDRARLELDPAPTVAPVRADPGQIDQVVINLVMNARDAIADSGTVVVRTADATVESGRLGWPTALPPGGYVALTVADTGGGMTDEVKARMFEPFFSTKGDRGTGIGLATVREVVREAGGHIEVESAVGWGTTVRVYWPRVEPALRVVSE
jgi:signal transduction histidine kinase